MIIQSNFVPYQIKAISDRFEKIVLNICLNPLRPSYVGGSIYSVYRKLTCKLCTCLYNRKSHFERSLCFSHCWRRSSVCCGCDTSRLLAKFIWYQVSVVVVLHFSVCVLLQHEMIRTSSRLEKWHYPYWSVLFYWTKSLYSYAADSGA